LEELPYEEDRSLQGEDWVLAYMHFEQILGEMPEQQRKCLQLMVDGLSHEEIASCLKLGLGTVHAYISQGRKRLRLSFFGTSSKNVRKSTVLQRVPFGIAEGKPLSENTL
jgi:DNA-directed RNA polymerase specialized sigma24 family protein